MATEATGAERNPIDELNKLIENAIIYANNLNNDYNETPNDPDNSIESDFDKYYNNVLSNQIVKKDFFGQIKGKFKQFYRKSFLSNEDKYVCQRYVGDTDFNKLNCFLSTLTQKSKQLETSIKYYIDNIINIIKNDTTIPKGSNRLNVVVFILIEHYYYSISIKGGKSRRRRRKTNKKKTRKAKKKTNKKKRKGNKKRKTRARTRRKH